MGKQRLCEIKAQLAKMQVGIVGGRPDNAARKLSEQARLFADIAKKSGIQPQ